MPSGIQQEWPSDEEIVAGIVEYGSVSAYARAIDRKRVSLVTQINGRDGLRDRVVLRVDGGLKDGRDVIMEIKGGEGGADVLQVAFEGGQVDLDPATARELGGGGHPKKTV